MWAAFRQDLSALSQTLGTSGLLKAIEGVTEDIVGHSGAYAGDEILAFHPDGGFVLHSKNDGHVVPEVLLDFQERYETFATPISEVEQLDYDVWLVESPMSLLYQPPSYNRTTAKEKKAWAKEQTSTLNEVWQRLVDFSPEVGRNYARLVRQDSRSQSAVATYGKRDESVPDMKENTEEEGRKTPRCSTLEDDNSPLATAPENATLDESDFFSRYFFRLWQLRHAAAVEAQRRRDTGEESTARMDDDEGTIRVCSPSRSVGSSQARDDAGGLFAPLFARRVMNAATELVSNLDHALTAESSPLTGGAEQIQALEELVQELQSELRKERARTEQLSKLLTLHHVELPPMPVTPQATPLKVPADGTTSSGAQDESDSVI